MQAHIERAVNRDLFYGKFHSGFPLVRETDGITDRQYNGVMTRGIGNSTGPGVALHTYARHPETGRTVVYSTANPHLPGGHQVKRDEYYQYKYPL